MLGKNEGAKVGETVGDEVVGLVVGFDTVGKCEGLGDGGSVLPQHV